MRAASFLCALTALLLAACSGSSSRVQAQPERAAEINLELAIDYLRKGNLVSAKEKVERALDQNPRNARAHSIAAMLYDRLGEEKAADSHYERAVSLDAKNPEIRNSYAVYLCQKGRYPRGEKYALEAAQDQLYKTREVGYFNAGNCARGAGDLERAEAHYRQALQVRPRFPEALLQLADMQFERKEYISARAFLTRYSEIGRTSPTSLWLGFRIERGLGNESEAQHYARRLKSEYPNAAQTKALLQAERNPG